MSDWRNDPAQIEERSERAALAVEKMKEGLNEYLESMRDDGDIETIENAVVIFEAKGLSLAGRYFKPGHIYLEQEGSYNAMIGLLQTRSSLIAEQLMHHACTCHDDAGD